MSEGAAPPALSLARLCAYFLRLGTLGFGGPIALAAAMQSDLVERRGWVTREEYAEGLALAQLAPGPLAAQLAMYLGWLRAGVAGATAVGLAFVGPSFLMVLALSALYVAWGGLAAIQAVFAGVGAAVVGLVALGAVRLSARTLGRDPLSWTLFAAVAVVTAATGLELPSLVVASGLVALLAAEARRAAAGAHAALLPVLPLFLYFAKAGTFVFGSGLAIVPFLHGGVVLEKGWLTERQFLDAVAVAMITPGPVVITVAFIGYLVAGPAGAVAAALGVFLPVWLVVVLASPWVRRLVTNARVGAFVRGVTAAATGALAGAALVLARGAVHDILGALVAAAALLLVVRKVPEPLVVLGAALAGLVA